MYECIYIEGENSADGLVCLKLLHLINMLTHSLPQIIQFYFTLTLLKKEEEQKIDLKKNITWTKGVHIYF